MVSARVFPTGERGAVEDLGEAGGLDAVVIGDGWQLGDVDIAERDAIAMAEPADVAGAAFDALVVGEAGGHVVEIGAQDDFAVEFLLEDRAHHRDAFLVPLAHAV